MTTQLQPIQIQTLDYPIQIKSWKVKVGDLVKKDQPLGLYEYIETIDGDSFSRRAEIRVSVEGKVEFLQEIQFISHSIEY
jgi:multidrug efflux pump subunit AcrA (membrane-fusion protein)